MIISLLSSRVRELKDDDGALLGGSLFRYEQIGDHIKLEGFPFGVLANANQTINFPAF